MRKPKGFRPAEGIKSVFISDTAPHFIKPSNLKGKLKAGVDYEAAVHVHYAKIYKKQYIANPWLYFEERRGKRWCQPDALIVDEELRTITILEMKLKHCAKSWWQLHKLYYPVVKKLFGTGWTYSIIEVSQVFDPATNYPVHVNKVDCIQRALPYPVTNVMLWRN